MPVASEIERKFRVTSNDWRAAVAATRRLQQAYLSSDGLCSLRVRISNEDAATLTIKTSKAGIERDEFEYPIPVSHARELIELRVGAVISKTRHIVPTGDHVWEIDVFDGENAGLVIAEIELTDRDEAVARPDWLGEEITEDRRYYNSDLSRHPFSRW